MPFAAQTTEVGSPQPSQLSVAARERRTPAAIIRSLCQSGRHFPNILSPAPSGEQRNVLRSD
jgi:hypothetical protein